MNFRENAEITNEIMVACDNSILSEVVVKKNPIYSVSCRFMNGANLITFIHNSVTHGRHKGCNFAIENKQTIKLLRL